MMSKPSDVGQSGTTAGNSIPWKMGRVELRMVASTLRLGARESTWESL